MDRLIREKSDFADILLPVLLCCIWLLMILSVNPVGNFPLNDDWSYGSTVKHLVEEGSFHLTGWVSMPLVAQVLWGSLFCLPFGFSFTALRLSTLTMGLIGVLATYALLREIKASRSTAFVGALLIAVNPLYFELSNTFMTDVPFTALTILSFVFFIRGTERKGGFHILMGTVLCCLATLIRQLGIVIPLSFCVAYLIRNKPRGKALLAAAIPPLLTVSVLIGYQVLLQSTVGLPALYSSRSKDLYARISASFPELLGFFAQKTGESLAYVGLFLLPFSVLFLGSRWKSASSRERIRTVAWSSSLVIVVMAALVWQDHLMPFLGNIWFGVGLGPVRLGDVSTLKLPNLYVGPTAFRLFITILSLMGALMFLIYVCSLLRSLIHRRSRADSADQDWLLALIGAACTLYFIPIGIAGLFDRYLLFFLPLAMAMVVLAEKGTGPPPGRLLGSLSVFLLLAYAAFTLGGTHDYLSWNRVRWEALDHLTDEAKISYTRIDGGFEFNGWYGYDPEYTPAREANGIEKSWWWVRDDEYMISFGPVQGYHEVARYSYDRWIPFRKDNVFILHRSLEAPRK